MTVSKEIFKAPDKYGTADQLTDHMPDGKVWQAKAINDTNLRGLVVSTAYPFNLVQAKIEEFICEFDIRTTTKFIDEWEESVGLPDDCFGADTDTDIQSRRNAVIERYKKEAIVTLAEMQAYVDAIFGVGEVTLYNGTEYYSFEREFQGSFLGNTNEKFIIVAEVLTQGNLFERNFEDTFTGALDTVKINCVLRRVVPANVLILFIEKSPDIVIEDNFIISELGNIIIDEFSNPLIYPE